MEKIGFDGYPFCFIDGIVVEPAEKEILKHYITKLVEQDFTF